MHAVLKAPCKNDAGFTESLVACSELALSLPGKERSSVCVWLADKSAPSRCTEMPGLLGRQLANARQKEKFSLATSSLEEGVYI